MVVLGMNGHLEVVKWAREYGCNWSRDTCWKAASNGHLEVLKWARGMAVLGMNILVQLLQKKDILRMPFVLGDNVVSISNASCARAH